ncbi:ribonuclease P protein component [Galbibacter sp. EGI 63066]|uniref:ribonuclease P protein component n=1 Tax=Galbibacter sp. EGI 63066 TaxID=2993559 RepID=UPI0022489685|nr:ribonuclease P protein component [Galbibacter sp. EGI 63066]MCX2679040.1 ribonuclease P protein component [Galbibacter sp. EGI 63066]
MDQSFPKKEKLKSVKRIEQLFTEGSVVSKYPLRLVYLKTEDEEVKIKAGVSVSKRNFKKAVDRNRIKRLMREAYRLNKHLFFTAAGSSSYAMMFLYTGKEMPAFEKLMRQIQKLHQKFEEAVKME